MCRIQLHHRRVSPTGLEPASASLGERGPSSWSTGTKFGAFADLAFAYPLACGEFRRLGARALSCSLSSAGADGRSYSKPQRRDVCPAGRHGQARSREVQVRTGLESLPRLRRPAAGRAPRSLRIPFGAVVPWAFSDRPDAPNNLWCRREELHLHGISHQALNLARLLVPPRPPNGAR